MDGIEAGLPSVPPNGQPWGGVGSADRASRLGGVRGADRASPFPVGSPCPTGHVPPLPAPEGNALPSAGLPRRWLTCEACDEPLTTYGGCLNGHIAETPPVAVELPPPDNGPLFRAEVG